MDDNVSAIVKSLNSFKEWGIGSFDLFNGDWIICILDKVKKNIIIAKDGLGTKPIYVFKDKDIISFCSEIKGFRALGSIDLITTHLACHNFLSTI